MGWRRWKWLQGHSSTRFVTGLRYLPPCAPPPLLVGGGADSMARESREGRGKGTGPKGEGVAQGTRPGGGTCGARRDRTARWGVSKVLGVSLRACDPVGCTCSVRGAPDAQLLLRYSPRRLVSPTPAGPPPRCPPRLGVPPDPGPRHPGQARAAATVPPEPAGWADWRDRSGSAAGAGFGGERRAEQSTIVQQACSLDGQQGCIEVLRASRT